MSKRPLITGLGGRLWMIGVEPTWNATFAELAHTAANGTREVGMKLWRRRRMIVGVSSFLWLFYVLVLFNVPPRYTAEASVMIDSRVPHVLNVEAVLSGLPSDAETVQSEMQVVKSRTIAEEVVRKLRLDQLPEFNRALRPPFSIARLFPIADIPQSWLPPVLRKGTQDAASAPAPLGLEDFNKVVSRVLKQLDAWIVGRSRVIDISFECTDADLAAKVVDAWADAYVVSQLDRKLDATRRANTWLTDHSAELRKQMEDADARVESFRRQANIIESGGQDGTFLQKAISELSTQLTLASTQRDEIVARLRQVEKAAAGGGTQALNLVLQSPLIQTLTAEEAKAEARLADLSAHYGQRYPTVIAAQAEVDDIRRKLQAEAGKIVQGLRGEADAQRARVGLLQAAVDQRKAELDAASAAAAQLHALERDAAANRSLYETFLLRAKETAEQEGFQQPDANVISRAIRPEFPSFPRKLIMLPAGLVAAIGLAMLFVLLLELRDHGFRSMDEVEALGSIAALGLIPVLRSAGRGVDVVHEIIERPASAFCESLRALYSGLAAVRAKSGPNTLLFTSAVAEEGKTTVSVAFACLLARMGKNVLLVDCDLWRPQVHLATGVEPGPGLAEIFAGKIAINDAVQRDSRTGLNIIAAGNSGEDGPDAMFLEKIGPFIRSAERSAYDVIIFDSAPVLAVASTRLLAGSTQMTVLLARWAETRRKLVLRSLKMLMDGRAKVAGLMLTRVAIRKHSQYGYSDSGLYDGKLRRYYAR